MAVHTLPPLASLASETVRLARTRALTLFLLSLFPAIPLVLVIPFLLQAFQAVALGVTQPGDLASFVAPWVVVVALVGLIVSFFVSLGSTAGMFVALGSPVDQGPRAAFRAGTRRWWPFLWTQVLVALAAFLVLLPGLLFVTWARDVAGLAGLAGGGDSLLSIAVLLVTLLLIAPVFLVVTWYAFAVIPAARGDAAGPAAIRISHELVQGATGRVFWLLLVWLLFEMLLSLLLRAFFPGLSLFTGFVYYVLTTVLGSAYLVVVYNALRRA